MARPKTKDRAAARRTDVVTYVQRALLKNPSISTGELQAGASEIDAAVRKLDARSFNARYVLVARRAIASGKNGKRRPRRVRTRVGSGNTPNKTQEKRTAVLGMLFPLLVDAFRAQNEVELMKVVESTGAVTDRILSV